MTTCVTCHRHVMSHPGRSQHESRDLLDKCTLLLQEENEGGRNGAFEDATPNLYIFFGVRGFRIDNNVLSNLGSLRVLATSPLFCRRIIQKVYRTVEGDFSYKVVLKLWLECRCARGDGRLSR